MKSTVFSLSISARALLNLHSLNNEGGEGNQIQTRMADVFYYDADGEPKQANVNAISGDMFKHIQVEHLHRIAIERGLKLCSACQRLDANRMSADPTFREWIKEKPTQVQVLDKLVQDCTIDDLAGNLITEGSLSVPRKSIAEYGWIVGLPEAVVTEEYFHVKYAPDRREKPTDDLERKGNLGQAIFHRPASSGVYAMVANFETSRIGYNDINQTYVEAAEERQARYEALLESILYTFVEMNGAMRNTQLPHMVGLQGVLAASFGVVPAPTVSPINPNYIASVRDTADALNKLHGKQVIAIQQFNDVGDLAKMFGDLIQNTSPFVLKTGNGQE